MLNPFRSLTSRTTALLVAMVAMSILVMAGLGYTTVDRVTEHYGQGRIDHAARTAAALVSVHESRRFRVRLDSEGRPLAFALPEGENDASLSPQSGDDALLAEIAQANRGAATLYRFRPETRDFERIATTLRDAEGQLAPVPAFGASHPAHGALVSGAVHVGQVPVLGRLRLAYLVPVMTVDERIAGALSIDIGAVEELVSPRDGLREDIAQWSIVLLLLVASLGALIQAWEMRPLRAIARFSHGFVTGDAERAVPGLGRRDEIGDVAEGLARVIALQADLERLAFSDALTGLGNRTRYLADLAALLAEGAPAALLMLDLDRFKETNDAFGQAAGDELLMRARDLILAELEEGDRLARIGGDDFAVLTRRATAAGEAQALAQRIMARLFATIRLPQGEVHAGCAIGIVLLPQHGSRAEEVHHRAELALRAAKSRESEPCILYHPGLDEALQGRLKLARLLRAALEANEISIHLQPQMDWRKGRIYGFEALARWTHPELGVVPPSEFVPVAEAHGLIPALGHCVLEQACALARQWQDAKFEFGRISVNVSTIEFSQPNYAIEVRDALARHGIPGDALCLEVTESVFLQQDETEITSLFKALHALGVRLSLDDFGTGYSSLGYLNRLPLDEMKIDRCFVQGVDASESARNLLAGIVALGKGLGLELVAEGAETEAQLAVLRELGCAIVQGYAIGRPVTPLMAPLEADRLRALFATSPGRGRANAPKKRVA